MNKIIYCYTDGSCLYNNQSDITKRRGGIGVFFQDSHNTLQTDNTSSCDVAPSNSDRNISRGFIHGMLSTPLSNQTMELRAIYEAMVILFATTTLPTTTIYLYTDSKYCYSILTKWAEGWKANNWKKKDNSEIKNLELIKKVFTMYQNIKTCTTIDIIHIRAHKKAPAVDSPEYHCWYGNNQADIMAQAAAKNISK